MSSDRIGLDQALVQQEVDEAELAAVAFLARYSGRTLEAYRQDLRFFFSWTVSVGLEVLAATRPHIELFRHHMEQRGLAASTIDRRLATVCGLFRFAHIDGRIASNPAQYVRRPKVHPSQGHGMEAPSSAASCSLLSNSATSALPSVPGLRRRSRVTRGNPPRLVECVTRARSPSCSPKRISRFRSSATTVRRRFESCRGRLSCPFNGLIRGRRPMNRTPARRSLGEVRPRGCDAAPCPAAGEFR
ncbi:MAG: tyrosine-type recombinase/integrase [Acidimicrobiales bacterium]